MNTSKISYDALKVEGLKDVLTQVSTVCRRIDIDFFIVGAIARNIWYVSNDENPTGTKDIDFGIYISTQDDYNSLRNILMEKYDYVKSSTNAFCLLTPDGKQIDLLPFGAIKEEGQVMIDGKGLTSINLAGFNEAFQFGTKEAILGNETYKTCTIPGIVMLKMIAYDDRPDQRVKDVKDVNAICINYPSIEQAFIWENHSDLYDGQLEHDEVAMIVLGREIKQLLSGNIELYKRLLSIIQKAIDQHTDFLKLMIDNPVTETLEMKKRMISLISIGFQES